MVFGSGKMTNNNERDTENTHNLCGRHLFDKHFKKKLIHAYIVIFKQKYQHV